MLKSNYSDHEMECGLDEAGRGCLAGPVTAAAVIFKPEYKNAKINDSKKLNLKERSDLTKIILKNSVAFSISHVYPKEIDKINILNASILAMHKCLDKLGVKPEFLIVDGNKFKKYKDIPHKTIIKGDQKHLNIAAASILAKNARDNFMQELHYKFPEYSWLTNKGYPTKTHKKAIIEFGITKFHRKSFKLYDEQLIIDF
jgi:ribonuclease HII